MSITPYSRDDYEGRISSSIFLFYSNPIPEGTLIRYVPFSHEWLPPTSSVARWLSNDPQPRRRVFPRGLDFPRQPTKRGSRSEWPRTDGRRFAWTLCLDVVITNSHYRRSNRCPSDDLHGVKGEVEGVEVDLGSTPSLLFSPSSPIWCEGGGDIRGVRCPVRTVTPPIFHILLLQEFTSPDLELLTSFRENYSSLLIF